MTETSMQDLQDQLLDATLAHVPFEGWTWRAMRLAAADLGHDATMAERAFPGGPVEMVEYFSAHADRLLEQDLAALGVHDMPVRERIETAIRTRLSRWVGHREAIRRASTLLALPQNNAAAARATWRTVDVMWWATGDESVDFSYYTKRASLAAVYSATLLVWFEDKSDDFADTWSFLRRRLEDMSKLPRLRKALEGSLKGLPNPLALVPGLRGGLRKARRRFDLDGDLHSRA